ncbi:hypothetical protein V6N11_018132 [Hibiscus sabdariffa]|uniref:Uncharacterized protein n=1 Tax=Hibiscus sabdariffa TaxID=183260 RepID=A0ABR2T743_9ROSI
MAQSVNKNIKVWKVKGDCTNVEVGEPSNSLPNEQQHLEDSLEVHVEQRHLGDSLEVHVEVEQQQTLIEAVSFPMEQQHELIEVVSSPLKVLDIIGDFVCEGPVVGSPLVKDLDDVEFPPLVSPGSQRVKAQGKGAKKGFASSSRTVTVLNGGEKVIDRAPRLASQGVALLLQGTKSKKREHAVKGKGGTEVPVDSAGGSVSSSQ